MAKASKPKKPTKPKPAAAGPGDIPPTQGPGGGK